MKSRHIAHITIEAQTPIKVGSNASDFLQDSPIQRDFNDLPMILGTSIAGVLRKEFDKKEANEIFGDENTKQKEFQGSKIIFSNALLLDENEKVHEQLLLPKSQFLDYFSILPIREHVKINAKGVAQEHAKFDEEVLYAGSRFKFSIEMLEDENGFKKILSLLESPTFRLGGGGTKGFGKFKILEIQTQSFDIKNYGSYSSSLNHTLQNSYTNTNYELKNYTHYTLKLTPDDFFLFGSGFGDKDADSTPVYESWIDYKHKTLTNKKILIPASSIKGALAHRTAFHYNVLMRNTIESKNGIESVEAIFGSAKGSKGETKQGTKGKLLLSDIYLEDKRDTKTFDHVAIDHFTGGAIDGALFQEKTVAQKDEWEIEILLHTDVKGVELVAFENALKDITTGMLQLGGMTTKGHGVLTGKLYVDGAEYAR